MGFCSGVSAVNWHRAVTAGGGWGGRVANAKKLPKASLPQLKQKCFLHNLHITLNYDFYSASLNVLKISPGFLKELQHILLHTDVLSIM